MVKTSKSYRSWTIISAGVTLVEVMVALSVLVIAVLPIIGAFTKFYGVSTKQLEQEIALKMGEATMNKLLEHRFSDLAKSKSFIMPLDFKIPNGNFTGNLKFDGKVGKSDKISIGNSEYQIEFNVAKIFQAQNFAVAHNNAISFNYPFLKDVPPNTVGVETYSCADDFLSLKVEVKYSKPIKKIELLAFRADMTK